MTGDYGITVDKQTISLTGESQHFQISIKGDTEWYIISSPWIECDVDNGKGPATLTFYVDETLFDARTGSITINSANKENTMIYVQQEPVFSVSTDKVLVRSFKDYNGVYELYALKTHLETDPEITNEAYGSKVSDLQLLLDKINYKPDICSNQSEFYYIPGFELLINGKNPIGNMAVYVIHSEKDLAYYQKLSRDEIISFVRKTKIEQCFHATWPGFSYYRFHLEMKGPNNSLFYFGSASLYEPETALSFSLLNYTHLQELPSYGTQEYQLAKYCFDGREFTDEDNNIHNIRVSYKTMKDIQNVDISLEKLICPYSFDSNASYPIVQYFINDELQYELILRMYTSWFASDTSTDRDWYCTEYSSDLAIDGKCMRIDFYSGVSDGGEPWFCFWYNHLSEWDGQGFNHADTQTIYLSPINNGDERPLVDFF